MKNENSGLVPSNMPAQNDSSSPINLENKVSTHVEITVKNAQASVVNRIISGKNKADIDNSKANSNLTAKKSNYQSKIEKPHGFKRTNTNADT